MIPLRDENPTRTVSFVTFTLIGVNALVFFHQISLSSAAFVEAFVADFALVPAAILRPHSPEIYATVVTSMFLHGGWAHLLGNMLFLWIFGNNIEDSVGHFKFVIFYLLCGVGAAAAQVSVSPDSTTPMIGASGAVSGVLGAYLLVFPRARVLVLLPIFIFWRIIRMPAWALLIFWFGLQLFSGLLQLGVNVTGGVAFWAHIGGFIAGIVLIPMFKKPNVRLVQ